MGTVAVRMRHFCRDVFSNFWIQLYPVVFTVYSDDCRYCTELHFNMLVCLEFEIWRVLSETFRIEDNRVCCVEDSAALSLLVFRERLFLLRSFTSRAVKQCLSLLFKHVNSLIWSASTALYIVLIMIKFDVAYIG